MEMQYLQNAVFRTFEIQALAQQAALQPQVAMQAGSLRLKRDHRERESQVLDLSGSAEPGMAGLSASQARPLPGPQRLRPARGGSPRGGLKEPPSGRIDIRA